MMINAKNARSNLGSKKVCPSLWRIVVMVNELIEEASYKRTYIALPYICDKGCHQRLVWNDTSLDACYYIIQIRDLRLIAIRKTKILSFIGKKKRKMK